MLEALAPANGSDRGTCVVCGDPVREGDPFLRYRGEYYHAHVCVECNPPALPTARDLAARDYG